MNTVFDAIDQVKALRAYGYHDACCVQCDVNYNKSRDYVVFKTRAELSSFRQFNRDWDVTITEIKC